MQFQQNQKVIINGGTITISGSVTIAGGSVAISGTPNVNVTGGTVSVTGSVSITGTANVNITGGTVAISGTPTVQFASGQTVSITGTPNVNVSGGSINISSGSVSISAGTITSITNAVTVLNDVTTLFNVSYQFNLGNYTNTFTVVNAAAGLRLVLLPSLLNLDIGGTIGIFVTNNTNNSIWQSTGIIGKFPPYGAGGSSGFQVDIPIAVDGGDSVSITLTDNQGGLGIGNATKIILLGLSNPPVITTSPGVPVNTHPLGGLSKVSVTQGAVGTTVLLAAPPTGTAYAIKRLVFAGIAAGGTYKVVGHTSGVRAIDYVVLTAVGVANTGDTLEGLLYAEGLDIVSTGNAITCDIHYDIVAMPVFQ